MASTGHSETQASHSIQSKGSMTRKFGPSRKAYTGQTAAQCVYLHLIQGSVITYAMELSLEVKCYLTDERYCVHKLQTILKSVLTVFIVFFTLLIYIADEGTV